MIIYRCTLSEVALTDEIVPISSFQMRLRQSPLQCYLSVVIPDILTYADIIAARQDGEITLTHSENGSETELLTANISSVRIQMGGRNRTGTIVGYKQITFPGTGSITIAKPEYRSVDGAEFRYRARPEKALKPTDDAIVTGWETVAVGEISWNVNPSRSVMEFESA